MKSASQESSEHRAARADLGIAQWHISPRSIGAFTFATVCVAVASLLHWGLGFLITEDAQHFTTFYPAVLFAALVGGAGAGTFATLLSGIIARWAFMPPHFAFFPITSEQIGSIIIYIIASLLLVWSADHYRRLTKRLADKEQSRQAEERFRKLAIEELAHRLKNKIATIQSVISYQLRESPQLRDAIVGRLIALSATDDLILAAQGQGARLRAILSTELGPYKTSRVTIEGPAIFLEPKLATTMALVFHELSTNAAKYGALSVTTGRVNIFWSLSDTHLKIEWRESGGPLVATPIHCGFGTRLLTRALEDFGGTVETIFETTGLICKLSAMIPENSIGPHVNFEPDTKRVAAE